MTHSITVLEMNDQVLAARTKWRYRGAERPPFAHAPAPGQRSVWDFPRPPRVQARGVEVRVACAGVEIGRSRAAVEVLETAGAPTVYLPPTDVDEVLLETTAPGSLCEWKGLASGVNVRTSQSVRRDVGWRYLACFPEFVTIAGWYSFYPGSIDCWVGDERVVPQPGGFYGGWVTSDLAGPIKGESGSEAW